MRKGSSSDPHSFSYFSNLWLDSTQISNCSKLRTSKRSLFKANFWKWKILLRKAGRWVLTQNRDTSILGWLAFRGLFHLGTFRKHLDTLQNFRQKQCFVEQPIRAHRHILPASFSVLIWSKQKKNCETATMNKRSKLEMVPWQKSFMQIQIDIRYHFFQRLKASYSR